MAAMAYAGALPFVRNEWGMDAAAAGTIQAVFNITNAVALLLAAWLSDRHGARRVYLISAWAGTAAMLAFALFARSYTSALILAAAVAATQGGTYSPALILVTEIVPPTRRGQAMGQILAAASLGYLLSILSALGGSALLGYGWGFAFCAVGPIAGAILGTVALRRPGAHQNPSPPVHEAVTTESTGLRPARDRAIQDHRASDLTHDNLMTALLTPASLLLILGYTAHCWELLGMWAWMPSFLTQTLTPLQLGPVLTGLIVAVTIHLCGVFANLTVGRASDHWGRKRVLLAVAMLGAAGSLSVGWTSQWGWGPVASLILAGCASFFILGDSGVLSAAMTEAVPPHLLGTALAFRSIIGFSAGAISPIVFGLALDGTGQWGWAFAVLGAGGMVATLAAACLPRMAK